ncbi:DNA alkylation repair protein [Roseobacter sp. YSTF-M11]|uniref:DNA alkylation repair protein n=1 Tax=Roseobacter insulae TaxID=2859783 RepID=A0A9X1FVM4_9RHOB|nr:DNA alkylation repair protein [Roseobacter insulae]MBW4707935.1 DNA alkylation repair protein [Roseobacter insulae]
MAERFSLKDHLFNRQTVGQLAQEYGAALPDFDGAEFQRQALAGFADRELLARLDWLADCVEAQLAGDFSTMADQLEAAMPAPLDPTLRDDDFGQFIHAVPGILAVRHGLDRHRERAMTLLHRATQRFSMEFYIRAFLNTWTEDTLADLRIWASDSNYHVRRLVSEGTRPKLPWAKAVSLTPEQTLPLLDALHGDRTRFVTRSVSNHLNDLSKTHPDLVLDHLGKWREAKRQQPKELDWMTRHALRSLIKQGHAGAMSALGYDPEAPVAVDLMLDTPTVAIGDVLKFGCRVSVTADLPVLVDYRITFSRPEGRQGQKVFKLKQGKATPTKPFEVSKAHKLKGDATTFRLHPGPHLLTVQVNGVDRAEASFELT